MEEDRTADREDERSEIEKLRELVGRYEDIIRCMPLGFIFVDEDDHVAVVNPVGEKIRCVGDRLGGSVQDCHPPGTHDTLNEVMQRFRETPPEEQHPIVLERLNHYEVSYTRVSSKDGAYRGILWLSYDIRRRKKLESELMHAERLAGLGRMASKVAHDIKNPLNAIQGAAHHLQKVCLDGEVGDLGGLIKSQVTRIASLLDRVQQLTKPLQSELTPTDLVKLVETQLQAFRLAYPGTTWDCDVDREVSSVLCDPQLIERLVSNAAENAVCAMDGSGEVVVEVGLDVQPDGSWAEIRFRDLGPGFPQTVLEHLFEPFVSTRPDGTGLGLTIMREICLLHGGDLSVRNTDTGALVTARLRTQ